MRVLVTTVDLRKTGGVASYYRAIERYRPANVDILTVGNRTDDRSFFSTMGRMANDTISYIGRVAFGSVDIVHVNPSLDSKALMRDGALVMLAYLFRKKVIVFIHGWTTSCEKALERNFLWLFKLVYFRTCCVIVLSSRFRDKLTEWGYTGRVIVESTAVDEALVEGLEEGKLDLKAADVSRAKQILFLARIETKKGIYILLDAYRKLKRDGRNIELVVAGSGSELPNVHKYVADHAIEDVKIVGHIGGEDIRRVFHAADLYVLPTSHGEGMPISVLEAMACGLPVITRPEGGIKDFFEDGIMGYLTESLEPETYAVLIQNLLDHPEKVREMSKYNFRFARSRFLGGQVADRLNEIYREVYRGGSRTG